MLVIREEAPADREKVYLLIKRAFSSAEHSDGSEQDLVNRLRESESFIPSLSLVAEKDGALAGYILFTKLKAGGETALALAPLAVEPLFQRQGIGSALIREGHKRAAQMGYGFSVVLGSEKYYPKFGYVPASRFGIKAPFDAPDENFMAADLKGENKMLCAQVVYDKAFGIL